MNQRTEDQIISQAPIVVTFGKTKYDIKPLTIRPAAEWRKKLVETCNGLLNGFDGQQTPQAMSNGLTQALIAFPEKILDLVIAYAPKLERHVLEQEATEEQVSVAFGAIMQVAYPFLTQLGTVNQVVKALVP